MTTIDFKGYRLHDYFLAIQRELAKRDNAYPKRLKRLEKEGATEESLIWETEKLYLQMQNLEMVLRILRGDTGPQCPNDLYYKMWEMEALRELIREMDCRIRYYPRMVFRKRITAQKAAEERALWEGLVLFFREEYTPSVKIQFLKTRCKILDA